MSFEQYVLPENEEGPKLNTHMFRAVLQEKIEGQKNNAECLAAVEAQLDVTLSADDISDLQVLLTAINGASTIPDKMAIADETYRIFILAESGVEWYDTRAKIKARLSYI